jgi:3-oxoacyl-[acyl-carrier protein] reductase
MSFVPDLTNKVALVTGGSRGVGRAIALALAGAGAHVAVNYRGRVEDAKAVADKIRASGRKAVAIGADVSQSAAVKDLVHKVEAELGSIDVLINNAGIGTQRGLDDLTEEEFDQTIAVNLKSAFLCTQAVLPGMRARKWGRIVNISSVAARIGGAVGPHYNASKAGLEGLTRGYAIRLVKDGVTVNAIAPGPIETEMAAPMKERFMQIIPMGRMGEVDEVAQLALMVIGNGFVTGQTIGLSGGLHFT